MIRENFKDAESVRSGQSRVTSQSVNHCLSHLIQSLVECYAILWECLAATMGRQAFGTPVVYRETFLKIQPRLLQHVIRKGSILGWPGRWGLQGMGRTGGGGLARVPNLSVRKHL